MSAILERRVETLEREGNAGEAPLIAGWLHGEDVRYVTLEGRRFDRMEGESVEELKERAGQAISDTPGGGGRIWWMEMKEG